MAKRQAMHDMTEDPRYHDTWKLLKRYRDVVWSMELSVQQLKTQFKIEYGSSIDEFLESVYLAGADLSGTQIEDHARCIERSNKMLTLVTNAVDLLRKRHKNGETYYWILYYTYFSPQQLRNVDEIITQLRPYIRDISFRTYYRRRKGIKHFDTALSLHNQTGTLICFDFQEETMRRICGPRVSLQCIDFNAVERSVLHISEEPD